MTAGKNDVYALTPELSFENIFRILAALFNGGYSHAWHTQNQALMPEWGRYATLIQKNVPFPVTGEDYWTIKGNYNIFKNNCVTRFGLPGIWNPSQYYSRYNYSGIEYYGWGIQ